MQGILNSAKMHFHSYTCLDIIVNFAVFVNFVIFAILVTFDEPSLQLFE